MPRLVAGIAVAVLAAAAVAGSTASSTQNAGAPQNITIAYQFGIGYAPLLIIKHQRLLEKAYPGLKVEWKQLASGTPITDGIIRAPDELLAEIRPEAILGVRLQRSELQHVEDTATATDPLAAIEERAAADQQRRDPDRDREGEGDEQEEGREHEVEGAEGRVAGPSRARVGELREAQDEGVGRLRRCGHAPDGKAANGGSRRRVSSGRAFGARQLLRDGADRAACARSFRACSGRTRPGEVLTATTATTPSPPSAAARVGQIA